MPGHDHSQHQAPREGSFLTSRAGLVLLGFLAVAGLLLLSEHRAHLFGALVWLLPLAGLSMHMFMHGGHGSHGSHGQGDDRRIS